jgi:signal transduction histidine kinase
MAVCAAHSFLYAVTPDSPPALYRTAASVLALTPEQASHGDPAILRGVVLRYTERGMALQDHTAGVWINSAELWSHSNYPRDLASGDEVEVIGVVDPGQFSPVVIARSIRKLGHSQLPKPRTVTFRQLSTGDLDIQYVSITGIVRSAGLRPSSSRLQRFWLKIEMKDGFIYASLPEEDAESGSKLIDEVVRIDAVAACTKNLNRQITNPTLMVSGIKSVTVLRPTPRNLFDIPVIPIGKLMQYRSGTDYYHRVRIAGVVTYYKPGESLILEDHGRALLVVTAQSADIHLGDRVEALGFPAPKDTGPILEDAVLLDIARGKPLQPAPVLITDLSSGSFNYNLVSTEGRLLRRVQEPFRQVLLLQDKSILLLAELDEPESSNALQSLQEGSTIRISGISMLDISGTWNTGGPNASTVRYKVLLHSPSDIQVIHTSSWFTTLHVIYIAAILAVLVLVFFALIVYGRMEGWRLQSVLEERERLAHEIHDTLAQSFAGIGFQLQAIQKSIPSDNSDLRQQVDLARTLVRHSHNEARRSIEPLTPESPEEIDLLSSLETSARAMVEGGSVEVKTLSTGAPRALSPQIAVTLLRIGQEAIANAVRHADPGSLEIAITYESHCVCLTVSDNGCGFVKSGDLLGFGLRGMRKRSAAISAKLDIVSQLGKGTRIEIVVPLPPRLTLSAFFKTMWKRLLVRIFRIGKEIN